MESLVHPPLPLGRFCLASALIVLASVLGVTLVLLLTIPAALLLQLGHGRVNVPAPHCFCSGSSDSSVCAVALPGFPFFAPPLSHFFLHLPLCLLCALRCFLAHLIDSIHF